MNRFFRIFELTKNQQRVVLIIMFVLIIVAFIGYERRVHHQPVPAISTPELKASPTPVETLEEQ